MTVVKFLHLDPCSPNINLFCYILLNFFLSLQIGSFVRHCRPNNDGSLSRILVNYRDWWGLLLEPPWATWPLFCLLVVWRGTQTACQNFITNNWVLTLDHSFNIVCASMVLTLLHCYTQSWNLTVSYSLKLLPVVESMPCWYLV